MHERFKGRLEQIGRFIRREKHDELERPHYISDDFELLGHIDFTLQNLMDRASLRHLQTALQKSNFDDVVDIGASSNFLRGVVFFNATKIKAIDPAYKWYDYEEEDPFVLPYPFTVFGGKANRQEMEKFLQYTCKNLQIPAKMNPNGVTLITGERHAKLRQFELIPEDANKWLLDQQSQSIGNFVVYRVFPSASAWGRIISSLKEGGILLTTGYGRLDQAYLELIYSETEEIEFEPDISQGGGISVDNTSLPLNGNSEAIGLTPVAQFEQINFYKKIRHFEPDIVSQAILENR